MSKIFAIIIIGLFLFNSCISIKFGAPGFNSGYENLSRIEKQRVIFIKEGIGVCEFTNSDSIYIITGKDLRSCLSKNDSSIVYTWSPNCSSSSCISLASFHDYCSKYNYNLYIVSDYFDFKQFDGQRLDSIPVFVANFRFYGSNYCNKYNKKFQEDLVNNQRISKENKYGRFLFFKGDSLVAKKSSLF